MVADDSLPDFPTPVVVSNKQGKARWTVSIPRSYDFPLEPEVYGDICMQAKEVADHVADLHSHKHVAHAAPFDYYHVDPNFMDVAEAEEQAMLPGPKTWRFQGKEGNLVGVKKADLLDLDVCEKSMTFVLEAEEAGFGPTLMMLWTAYGLAMREGRAFFVEDSKW